MAAFQTFKEIVASKQAISLSIYYLLHNTISKWQKINFFPAKLCKHKNEWNWKFTLCEFALLYNTYTRIFMTICILK